VLAKKAEEPLQHPRVVEPELKSGADPPRTGPSKRAEELDEQDREALP
jgi:hypothetical protein